jgi:5'-phosphate synthase pdxT subunit
MRVGVLALQGDWQAHARALTEVGVEAAPVRDTWDLAGSDALVLPGGESTAMLRLLEAEGLDGLLAQRIREGMPVLATCAGVILLAKNVRPGQASLGVLDVDVERNAYGRQIHSTVTPIAVEPEVGDPATMEAVFIRAPRMSRVGADVRVVGWHEKDAVFVVQGKIVATTFHPELTEDRRVQQLFCRLAEETNG